MTDTNVPGTDTADLLTQARMRTPRCKFQRWSAICAIYPLMLQTAQARQRDVHGVQNEVERRRRDALCSHYEACYRQSEMGIRQNSSDFTSVCELHLQQAFATDGPGSTRVSSILDRDRLGHSLLHTHVLNNPRTVHNLKVAMILKWKLVGEGRSGMLSDATDLLEPRVREALEQNRDELALNLDDFVGNEMDRIDDLANRVDEWLLSHGSIFIRHDNAYFEPASAVRPELKGQLYHEIFELQQELLRFARKKKEDSIRQGMWSKVQGWLRDLSCLAETVVHKFSPDIVSCNEDVQLRQAVDKLDLFWQGVEYNSSGPHAGAIETVPGRRWDDYPVQNSRVVELLSPDTDRRGGGRAVAGFGGDQGGKITRLGDTELEWAKRRKRRDEWMTIGGKQIEMRNDSDLMGKITKRLKDLQHGDGTHVSMASLLLSPSQRGHAMRLRGDRPQLALLDEFNPDFRQLTPLELDAKVPKERFQQNWLGPVGGDPMASASTLHGALHCKNEDIDGIWSRLGPDANMVSLAAIVALFSPSPEHRALARKRLIILAGGRSGPGTVLFGGRCENQIRGGALPEKSPHMQDGGDGYGEVPLLPPPRPSISGPPVPEVPFLFFLFLERAKLSHG